MILSIMFGSNLKITKTENGFESIDKKTGNKKVFPLTFKELTEEQQKIIVKYLTFSKIIGFFFPFIFFIGYEIRKLAAVFLGLFILGFLLPPEIINIIALITNVTLWIFVVTEWATLAYQSWSKRVLKKLYKKSKK